MTDHTQTLDSMCIPIVKIDEDDSAAIYEFTSTIWIADPEHIGRTKAAGIAVGTLTIDKMTGVASLLEPMSGDHGDKRYFRACRVLSRHFADGSLPDQTMFACG